MFTTFSRSLSRIAILAIATVVIRYRKSSNLDYDGNNIHPRYNSWIKKLDQTIQLELASLY